MRLKDSSVSIFGVRPELVLACTIVDQVFKEAGTELVITACTERTTKHMKGSAHYNGCAFDARTRDLTVKLQNWVADESRIRLGGEFDVVLESDHLHVEYQPKG